jgi:plasmid stabilization system protein ParE
MRLATSITSASEILMLQFGSLRRIDNTVDGLSVHPLKGRLRFFRGKDLQNIRSWQVDGFETYLIFYRFDDKLLDILRIRHGAMRFPRALRR